MKPCEHNDVTAAATTTDSTMMSGTPLSGPPAGDMFIKMMVESDDAVALVEGIKFRRAQRCYDHEPNGCRRCGV